MRRIGKKDCNFFYPTPKRIICSTSLYKYHSPEQELHPTERLVGFFTHNLKKPSLYHNIYYEYSTGFEPMKNLSYGP